MKLSRETREVFSELLVNFAVVVFVTIPEYFLSHDWVHLTISIIVCILITRIAIQLRKLRYDEPK
jgi:hypothetical protein